MVVFRALIGLLAFCLMAFALNDQRRRIPWRVLIGGLSLQIFLGWFILKTDAGNNLFQGITNFVIHLMEMNTNGTSLVFGNFATSHDGPLGFALGFATTGLPVIIFLSALVSILYYFGVMQIIVWLLARIMTFCMGVSGAESLCMATNIFMGQTESPLTIRPYLPRMTRSELNSVMTGGFATMAAGMIVVYIGQMGHNGFYGKHILAAEVMSAPAAFVICKLMRPETETPETSGKMPFKIDRNAHNFLEAASNGTRDGLHLWLNVIAMLISFSALLALVNWAIGSCAAGWSLERVFGNLLSPIAWLIGIDNWHDCQLVGSVMGTKIASNEFFGFNQLKALLPGLAIPATVPATAPAVSADVLSQRSAILGTYAICDFANFVSIGIQLGGMPPLAPERKMDFAKLAFRAMLGGCLASYMTAVIASLFI